MWKSTPTAVYAINDHCVWPTKDRTPVLFPPVDARAREVLAPLAEEQGDEVRGREVMPDHGPTFVSAPPAVSAKILKGARARRLFAAFPHLTRRLRGGYLWNPSADCGCPRLHSGEDVTEFSPGRSSPARSNRAGLGRGVGQPVETRVPGLLLPGHLAKDCSA